MTFRRSPFGHPCAVHSKGWAVLVCAPNVWVDLGASFICQTMSLRADYSATLAHDLIVLNISAVIGCFGKIELNVFLPDLDSDNSWCPNRADLFSSAAYVVLLNQSTVVLRSDLPPIGLTNKYKHAITLPYSKAQF